MKNTFLFLSLCVLIACTKEDAGLKNANSGDESASAKGGKPSNTFTTYTIRKGQHNCDQSTLKSVSTSEMKFAVKFDQSAIYQTVNPENQYDINKLWGFSEGFNHQTHSARIGWAWNENALRLYAYVYANGIRHSQEIAPVAIGSEITCGIKLAGNTYVFTVNGNSVTLPIISLFWR
jgi:hypothetical protein